MVQIDILEPKKSLSSVQIGQLSALMLWPRRANLLGRGFSFVLGLLLLSYAMSIFNRFNGRQIASLVAVCIIRRFLKSGIDQD